MRRKFFLAFLTLVGLWILPSPPGRAGQASDDLSDVYTDTEAFDGGPGSTLNTQPSVSHPVEEVPEVGPIEEVKTSTGTATGDKVETSTDTAKTDEEVEAADAPPNTPDDTANTDDAGEETNTTD